MSNTILTRHQIAVDYVNDIKYAPNSWESLDEHHVKIHRVLVYLLDMANQQKDLKMAIDSCDHGDFISCYELSGHKTKCPACELVDQIAELEEKVKDLEDKIE